MSKPPKTSANEVEFVPPGDQPVHLALTSGHTASVLPEGSKLHPRFHREAVMKGCFVKGTQRPTNDDDDPGNVQKTRDQILHDAIATMVTRATDDPKLQNELFTGDGRPDAAKLSEVAGFPIRANERDAAWERYESDPSGGADD